LTIQRLIHFEEFFPIDLVKWKVDMHTSISNGKAVRHISSLCGQDKERDILCSCLWKVIGIGECPSL
jgi:hypothetical protein